jgi:hypothetical protein
MNEKERIGFDVTEREEDRYVEAPANLRQCTCGEEHRLHIALSETRARPAVYTPDHAGIKNARCATFGRCR